MSTIKVNPNDLRNSGTKIKGYADRLDTLFKNINNVLLNVELSWQGRGFLTFQNEYQPLNQKMNKVVNHIHGISQNLNTVANEFEEADNKGVSSFGRAFASSFFASSLALKLRDISKSKGDESIVVSGNYYDDGKHTPRQFVEPAIKQIKDWKSQGKTNMNWIIADSGYDEKVKKQIIEAGKELGVTPIFITDKSDLINYINSGEKPNGISTENRKYNKISDISVFSHGTVNNGGTLELGYLTNPNLNITTPILNQTIMNRDAFTEKSYTWFASCNTGTIDKSTNTSFAQQWANKTNGTTVALAGGKTDYEDMNDRDSWLSQKIWENEDRIRRWGLKEPFDNEGSYKYPVKSTDGETIPDWYQYSKNKTPEKIEGEGGPR